MPEFEPKLIKSLRKLISSPGSGATTIISQLFFFFAMVDGELDLALSPVLLKVYMSKSIKKKKKKRHRGG